MKTIIKLTLLLALLLPATAKAYDFEVDGIYYNINGNEATVTSSGGEYSGDVTIPENVSYNGSTYSVTTIGYGAFFRCTGLTSVTIPNSVTSIGNDAFYHCSGLTSITIPNSVTSIGNSAFYYCTSLTSIDIPNSVTTIDSLAFYGCSGVTSINIPNSITAIGYNAFFNCNGIKNLTWNAINCSSNGDMATSNIECVTIGNEVQQLPIKFVKGSKITSITIPNSVTTIGKYAFEQCTSLTNIDIPNSVTTIGADAFFYCSGLTGSLTIPNSVTTIGSDAFSNCKKIVSVNIGNSVSNIGSGAFNYCSNLTRVNITDLEAWCNISFSGSGSNPCSYAHHLYLNDEEIKDLVIPNSITSIGNYAFDGCSQFTNVSIPNSVISIGNYAFDRCSQFTNVSIPNSVISIGDYAFDWCNGLTSITIPSSVTTIGEGAFASCSGLNKVNINDLEAWCRISFSDNYSNPCIYAHHLYLNGEEIEDLITHNYITSIYDYAFYCCEGLVNVTIPNSVTEIRSNAFGGCINLNSVTIPSSITTIGGMVFDYCTALRDVYCYIKDLSTISMFDYSFSFYGPDNMNSGYYSNRTLHVPAGTLEAYQGDTRWSQYFGNIVEMEPEAILATSIGLNVTTAGLNEGSTLQLTATVLPEDCDNKNLTWSSNNPSIATVDSNGLVTTHGVGTATITAITTDGSNLSTTCTVTLLPVGVKGDVNGDNNISIADVAALIDMLLSGSN